MNQQQTKYVINRIETIKRLKIDQVSRDFPDKSLDEDAIREALGTGAFTLREGKKKGYYRSDLNYYLIFDGETDNSELRKAKTDAIEKEARSLLDQVMLGEDEGLLEALKNFESKEF